MELILVVVTVDNIENGLNRNDKNKKNNYRTPFYRGYIDSVLFLSSAIM